MSMHNWFQVLSIPEKEIAWIEVSTVAEPRKFSYTWFQATVWEKNHQVHFQQYVSNWIWTSCNQGRVKGKWKCKSKETHLPRAESSVPRVPHPSPNQWGPPLSLVRSCGDQGIKLERSLLFNSKYSALCNNSMIHQRDFYFGFPSKERMVC